MKFKITLKYYLLQCRTIVLMPTYLSKLSNVGCWEQDFLSKVCPTKVVHKSSFCERLPTKNTKNVVSPSSFTRLGLVAHNSFIEGSLTTKNMASVHSTRIYAQLLHYMLHLVRKKDQWSKKGMLMKLTLGVTNFCFECWQIIVKHEKTSGMVDNKVDDSASKKFKKDQTVSTVLNSF